MKFVASVLCFILVVASCLAVEDAAESGVVKKTEKRGIYGGFGYGHYPAYYGGYGGGYYGGHGGYPFARSYAHFAPSYYGGHGYYPYGGFGHHF